MKPETNLFLRSLIGKEKARLRAEKTRIVSNNCAQSPASLRLPPEDVDKIIQIDRDAKELNSALSELKEEAKKQTHLGKQAPFIVLDDAHITTPATRPTDKDIERIRYELDRAIAIADNVNDCISLIRRYSTPGIVPELFLVEIAGLLRSVSNARTEFNVVYPEEK